MSWGDAANNILRHAVLRSRQAAAPTLARLRYAHGHPPHIDVPDGWQPHPETPLEQTLPYPWDHTYRTHFKQPFQPVMLWRNTLALCRYIEKDFDPNQRKLALDVLTQLFARMQEFTVQTDGAAWIENRFDYRNKEVVLPAPWVSGLGNAFALRRLTDPILRVLRALHAGSPCATGAGICGLRNTRPRAVVPCM